MPNVTKALFLSAALLTVYAAQAADPATGIEPVASASPRPEPPTAPLVLDGAQLFATHCAMCHKPAELARRVQSAADPATARADMAAFLARHGRSDADADAAIIEYLAESSFPGSGRGRSRAQREESSRNISPRNLHPIGDNQS